MSCGSSSTPPAKAEVAIVKPAASTAKPILRCFNFPSPCAAFLSRAANEPSSAQLQNVRCFRTILKYILSISDIRFRYGCYRLGPATQNQMRGDAWRPRLRASTQTLGLSRALAKAGHEVVVVTAQVDR